MKRLVLFSLLLSFFVPLAPVTRADAPSKKEKFSERFRKPMAHYLGIEGPALQRFSPSQQATIEQILRKYIEVKRFTFLKIPFGSGRVGDFIRKMVSVIAARSYGIAKMRATWDSQFQGYNVTSDMLRSIQNRSFLYWIELTEANVVRDETITYKLSVRVHIRQLVVFDCTEANRKISRRHKNACRHKKNSQHAGFTKPFKIFKASTEGFPHIDRKEALTRAVQMLGNTLVKKLSQVKEFTLHAPVERADLGSVLLPLGKEEGLYLNQGFDIYVRHISGRLIHRGYVKIRSVGDNRFTLKNNNRVRVNPKAPFYSRAEAIIVKGGLRLQKGMMAYEHPLTGFALGVHLGLIPFQVGKIKNLAPGASPNTVPGFSFPIMDGAVLAPALQLAANWDISSASNINEFYINIALDLGFVDFNTIILPFFLHLGVFKKFHIRQLVWMIGARAGAGLIYSERGFLYSAGGEALTGLEFFISPEFSLALRIGFRAHFLISNTSLILGPWATLGGFYTF